jgi:hypothetical protein
VLACTGLSERASARSGLDVCTLLPRAAIGGRIGSPLRSPHRLSTDPVAAGCHFTASATGGSDVALYASTDVPLGVTRAHGTSFFATVDAFHDDYGTPTPVDGIGTTAYTAFTPGDPARGALLVLQGPRRAVLVVFDGEHVTDRNTITRGRALARLVLNAHAVASAQPK